MPDASTPLPADTPPNPPAPSSLSAVAATVADWMDGHFIHLTCAAYRIPTGAMSGPSALLAALNRSGMLTLASQYARDTHLDSDDCRITRRAAVVLLVPGRRLRRRLRAEARQAGLFITEHRFPYFAPLAGRGGTTVSLRDGEPYQSFGARTDRAELRRLLPGCHPRVLREAAAARQVTIADPAWGRNDRLWPMLRNFTAAATTVKGQPLEPREALISYGESANLATDVLEDLTARTEDTLLDRVEHVIRSLPTTGATLDRDQVLHVLQAMRHQPAAQTDDEQPAPPADLLASENLR